MIRKKKRVRKPLFDKTTKSKGSLKQYIKDGLWSVGYIIIQTKFRVVVDILHQKKMKIFIC
jgi:hypothetical protein